MFPIALFLLSLLFLGSSCSPSHYEETRYTDTYWGDGSEEYYNGFIEAVFDGNNTFFYMTKDNKLRINDSYASIKYEGISYNFRKEHFEAEHDCCVYRFGDNDTYFQYTVFENGTQPSALYYTCGFLKSCAGLQCVWTWASCVVLVVLVGGVIGVYIIRRLMGRWC